MGLWVIFGDHTRRVELVRGLALGEIDIHCGNDSISCLAAKRQRDFENGENHLTGKTYRIMNEVPTVLLLAIVIMVVVRPF